MMETNENDELVELAAEVMSSYVCNNAIATDQLTDLI